MPDMVVRSSPGGPPRPAAASHCVEDAFEAKSMDKPPIDMALELRGPKRLPFPIDPPESSECLAEEPDRIDLTAASSSISSPASIMAFQFSPSIMLLISLKLYDRDREPSPRKEPPLSPLNPLMPVVDSPYPLLLLPRPPDGRPKLCKLLSRKLLSLTTPDDLSDMFMRALGRKALAPPPDMFDDKFSDKPEIVLIVLSEDKTVCGASGGWKCRPKAMSSGGRALRPVV